VNCGGDVDPLASYISHGRVCCGKECFDKVHNGTIRTTVGTYEPDEETDEP
jgi:hypothetical protein